MVKVVGFLLLRVSDLGEPTHTRVPCWMPKPLPPRDQCRGCFAPAKVSMVQSLDEPCHHEPKHRGIWIPMSVWES